MVYPSLNIIFINLIMTCLEKTEYVTITNRGNLQLVNGDFVSDALFENSRVYAFLE